MMTRTLSFLLCLIMVLGLAAPSVQASSTGNVSTSGSIMDGIYVDGDSGANIVIDGNTVSTSQDTKLPNPGGLVMGPPAPVVEYVCKCADLASAVEHAGVCVVKAPLMQLCEISDRELFALWGSYTPEEQEFILSYLEDKFPLKHIELRKLLAAPTGSASETLTDGTTVSAQGIPQNGSLTVGEATDAAQDIVDAYVAEKEEPASPLFTYDVSVQDSEGTDWQPETSVQMELEIPDLKLHKYTRVYVVHVDDNGKATTIPAEITEDGKIAFETPGFSTFAGFTVDFEYDCVQFSIPGETGIKLSELFENLKMPLNAEDVFNVEYTDYTQIKVEQIEGDWLLSSLKAFSTEEKLTLTMADGAVYQIKVTDAEETNADCYFAYRDGNNKCVDIDTVYMASKGNIDSNGYVRVLLSNDASDSYPTIPGESYYGTDGTYDNLGGRDSRWPDSSTATYSWTEKNKYENRYWQQQPVIFDGRNEPNATFTLSIRKFDDEQSGNFYLDIWQFKLIRKAKVVIDIQGFTKDDTVTIQKYTESDWSLTDMIDVMDGSSLTIKGASATNLILDGTDVLNSSSATNNQILFLGASAKELKCENVTFKRSYSGTVLSYANNADLISLKNCTFEASCTGAGNGCAIRQQATENNSSGKRVVKKLVIENCSFNSIDTANGNGAAIYLSDTINEIEIKGTTTFNNCDVTGTSDGIGYGGAICLNGTFPKVTITAQFTNCDAAKYGGAIANLGDLDATNFTGCKFTSCSAGTHGGAVYLGDGQESFNLNDIYFTGCEFSSCTTTSSYGACVSLKDKTRFLQFENCKFTGNTAKTHAGAINVSNDDAGIQVGYINLYNCTFSNNTATGNRGGALRIVLKTYQTVSDGPFAPQIDVQGCTFENNTAGSFGGAISVKGQMGNFTIKDRTENNTRSSFTSNTSGSRGGAIALNCTVVGDVAVNNTDFDGNSSNNIGGTIEIGYQMDTDKESNVTISVGAVSVSGCTFKNSIAKNIGGALALIDGTFASVSISDTDFENCVSPRYGGAICMKTYEDTQPFSVTGNVSIIGCSFKNCHAGYLTCDQFKKGADGKFISPRTPRTWDHDNNPYTPEIDELNGVGGGGAICFGGIIGGGVQIKGNAYNDYSLFEDCTSWNNAAAIFFTNYMEIRGNGVDEDDPILDMQYLNINKCFSRDAGSAIYFGQLLIPRVSMSDCTIQNCGFLDFTDPNFPKEEFIAAYGATLSDRFIVVPSSLTESTYRTKWKGYSYDDLFKSTDTGGTFRTIGNSSVRAKITSCEFKNNKSYYNGAGVYWNSLEAYKINDVVQWLPSLTITDTLFEGNYAHRSGGAIYCESTITVQSSEFKNNEAAIWGGAIAQQVYNNGDRPLGQSGMDEKNQIVFEPVELETGKGTVPSKLHGNKAIYGGAISITVTKTASVKDDKPFNYRMVFNLGGSHVYQNVASANGGGIYYATSTYANSNEQREVDYFEKEITIDNGVIWGNVAGAFATQVTDNDTLKAGDQLVISAAGSNVALGTTQNDSDRAQASVTKYSPQQVVYDNNTQVMTLKAGKLDGTFALQLSKDLYLAAGSGKELADVAYTDPSNSWQIQIDSITGRALMIVKSNATSDSNRSILRYNQSSSWFNIYTPGNSGKYSDLAIYRVNFEGKDGGVATLVTDHSTLKVDDRIIIVAPDYNLSLSTEVYGNTRRPTSVTNQTYNNITFGADTHILKLVTGTVEGTFGLKVMDGTYKGQYIKTTSIDNEQKNRMEHTSTLDNASSWSITIDAATGRALISSQGGASTRNTIRFNVNVQDGVQQPASGWFNNYAPNSTSNGTNLMDVAVYKVNSTDGSFRTATLVTDDSRLRESDLIIIVAKDYGYAMGEHKNGDVVRVPATVTKHNALSFGLDTQVVTLVGIKDSEQFALQTADGQYLTASADGLTTGSQINADSSWTLTVSGGKLTATANGKHLRHNASDEVFSCYGSAEQRDIVLYRLGVEGGGGYGGGIYMDSNQKDITDASGHSWVKITGGQIYGNIAYVGNGGGVYLIGKNAECDIGRSEQGEDPIIGAEENSKDDEGNLLPGNKAIGTTVGTASIGGYGGGIAIYNGAFISMTGGYVSGNKATVAGGGIAVLKCGDVSKVVDVSDGVTKDNPNIDWGMEFSDGTISGNIASTVGGGVYLSGQSTMKLSGGTVKENYAATATTSGNKTTYTYVDGQNGGGIAVCEGSKMNIYSGNVDENDARNGAGISIQGGSALQLLPDPTSSASGSVSGNYAHNYGCGGGIYLEAKESSINQNTLYVENGSIKLNKAYYGGGVAVMYGNKATLQGGDIAENDIYYRGGGVYVAGSTLTVSGANIYKNNAPLFGGGIYVEKNRSTGGTVYVTGGNIYENITDKGSGGGIFMSGAGCQTTVSGGKIYKNRSGKIYKDDVPLSEFCGGGISADTSSTLIVEGGEIYENYTNGYGGGIHSSNNANITVKGGIIRDNTATIGGGGVAVRENSTAIITKSDDGKKVGKISNNKAALGGGIYVIGGADLTVNCGQVTNNQAVGKPDDSKNIKTCFNLTELQVGDLKGVGGGIYVADGAASNNNSAFTLTGSPVAIYGNTADFAADDVFANANNTQLTVPTVDNMNLADFDIKPEGWVEDYVAGDRSYKSGLDMITKNGGTVAGDFSNVYRYRSANSSEQRNMLIKSTYVTSKVNAANTYVCMTLGIPNAYKDTVIVDFTNSVDINVWENDLFLRNDAQKNEFANGKSLAKDVGSYLLGELPAKGITETNGIHYSKIATGNGPAGTSDREQLQDTFAMLTNHGDGTVTYTPSAMNLKTEDTFYYAVAHNDYWYYGTVEVIPASILYYEDTEGFIYYYPESGDQVGWDTVTDGNTVQGGQASLQPGVEEMLDSLDPNRIFGYDSSYNSTTAYSGGSAHMATLTDANKTARAVFTFTGTGFDIISLCSKNTGTVMVSIYKGDVDIDDPSVFDSSYLYSYFVDTYYGYSYEDGEWVVDKTASADNKLYQVPIIKCDLTNMMWSPDDPDTEEYDPVYKNYGYGTYTVELFVGTSWTPGTPNRNSAVFYLDGVRIYNPVNDGSYEAERVVVKKDENGDPVIKKDANGKEIYENGKPVYETVVEKYTDTTVQNAYLADGEGWPVYQELRNMIISHKDVLKDAETQEGLIFIDGTTTPTLDDYVAYGPNNEVYLTANKALAFKLDALRYSKAYTSGEFDGNVVKSVHIAMRGLTAIGENDTCQVTIHNLSNGTRRVIALSTNDLYYDISDCINKNVKIENSGNIPVSITTVKVTHTEATQYNEFITPKLRMMFMVNKPLVDSALEILPPEELVDPIVTPKRPALSFNGMVCYNVFFTAEELGELTAADLGLAVFDSYDPEGTVETAKDVVMGATLIDGQYMIATNGVHAKYLGDTQYFRVFAKKADGTCVYSKMVGYSAVDYAKNALAKSNDVKLKQLVVAMLNYGAEAQKFFGYKTDDLMNKDLTADQQALLTGFDASSLNAVGKVDASKVGPFASTGGFTKRSPAISFKGAFEINYFFTPAHAVDRNMTLYFWSEDTYNSVSELTPSNADKQVIMTEENGTYTASSDEIAAKYLDKTLYVAAVYESDDEIYCSGVLPYSIAAYCQKPPATVQDLATAAAIYGCTAKQYFGV